MKSEKEPKLHWWSSNYSLKEKWNFLRYRVNSPRAVPYCEMPSLWKEETFVFCDQKPSYSIAFIGDFMPFGKRRLHISENLRHFLGTADTLVVNLEGVVTAEKRPLALNHSKAIFETIRSLNTHNILLNVANNHASDFGHEVFVKHLHLLQDEGFEVLGHDDTPYVLGGKFLLKASSAWSNQPLVTTSRFSLSKKVPQTQQDGCYNIFLPHWGYEMELFPRKKQVQFAKEMIESGWHTIIGNHPHCPQPVELYRGGIVAYSLGNFCYGNYNPNHWYGMALKLFFQFDGNLPQLNRVERIYTFQQLAPQALHITMAKSPDYATIRKKIRPSFRYLKDLLK